MSNQIQRVREAMQRDLASTFIKRDEHLEETSPCGQYQLVVDEFGTADPSYPSIVVAVVREHATGQLIATIMRNDSRLFYAWITRDGHDYLLFPEDLEGQSVMDLTDRRVVGFSSEGGGFIWTEFHPSPGKLRLAIVGCYWACPYEVTVYDFRDPMNLPLPVVAEFILPDSNARFGEWLSETSLSIRDAQGVVQIFEFDAQTQSNPAIDSQTRRESSCE